MKAEHKKTLILLIPGFPSNEADSTCLPAQQSFTIALKRNLPSIKIEVIAFQYPFRNEQYDWNGIPVLALNGRNRGGLSRLRIWLRAWNELRKHKRNKNVIGLLSFWCADCAVVGRWFASIHKLKHFCWILGQDAKKENKLVRLIRPSATELIALSPFLQSEFFRNHHVHPTHVIPNAIDPENFSVPIKERTIDVIGVGSLIPLKQYDVFISILKKVTEQFPSLRSIICGQGPEMDSLQKLIDEAGLRKNIQLVGEKSHPQVLELLQQSRILLHPSSYEGYSSVCLEALYAGAHVISFRSPEEGNIEHWHVLDSPVLMEKKIVEILSDPAADHNRVLVHSVQDQAKSIISLFDSFT